MIVSLIWWRCCSSSGRIARLELPGAPRLEDLARVREVGLAVLDDAAERLETSPAGLSMTAVTRGSIGRPPRSRLHATRTPREVALERARESARRARRWRSASADRARPWPRAAAPRPATVRAIGPSTENGAQPSSRRPRRHAPGRGPEADDIAEARRIAQRAPDVAAVGDRDHPGGERHRGAAARAAARLGRVIRVQRPAEDLVERLRARAELRRIGLADRDGAGGLDALDDEPVVRRARSPCRSASPTWCGGRASAPGPCGRWATRAAGRPPRRGRVPRRRRAPRPAPRPRAASRSRSPSGSRARSAPGAPRSTSVTEARRERIRSRSAVAVREAEVAHERGSMARRVYRKWRSRFTRIRARARTEEDHRGDDGTRADLAGIGRAACRLSATGA